MKRMHATDSTTGLQYGEAYCQLGDVYKDSENIGLALQAYLQGIQLSPSYDAGFCNFFYTATFACHWKKRSQHLKHLRLVMKKYLRGPDPLTHECVQPFQSLAYPLEPEELLEIATFHARKAAVHVQGLVGRQFVPLPHVQSLLTVSSARGGGLHRKLRIGFVSADYKDHPVVKDLIHMFSSFERSNFDIFCFALNPAAGPVGWEVQGWHETTNSRGAAASWTNVVMRASEGAEHYGIMFSKKRMLGKQMPAEDDQVAVYMHQDKDAFASLERGGPAPTLTLVPVKPAAARSLDAKRGRAGSRLNRSAGSWRAGLTGRRTVLRYGSWWWWIQCGSILQRSAEAWEKAHGRGGNPFTFALLAVAQTKLFDSSTIILMQNFS